MKFCRQIQPWWLSEWLWALSNFKWDTPEGPEFESALVYSYYLILLWCFNPLPSFVVCLEMFKQQIKECSPYVKQVFLLYHWASLVTLRSLLALYPWEDP